MRRDWPGETVVVGPVVDQAALHGLLARIRDLGLPPISVQAISVQAISVQTISVQALRRNRDGAGDRRQRGDRDYSSPCVAVPAGNGLMVVTVVGRAMNAATASWSAFTAGLRSSTGPL